MNRYKKDKLVFWAFLAPALLAFSIVVVIPFLMGIYYSLTDWTAIAGADTNWVGFANYKAMFSDVKFNYSFMRTIIFTLISVITINVISLMLALLVTRKVPAQSFFRAGFFFPNLIGGLVLGYIWQFIFRDIIPSLGEVLGIKALEELLILADPTLALFGLIAAFTWQYAGYIMMIYIAALLNVPQELIEASQIDGAGPYRRFKNITVPMIAQAFTITSFLTLVNSFKQYDMVISLTDGGPSALFAGDIVNSTEFLAVNIYNVAFKYNNMAEGQARAIVFFAVLAIVAVVQVYVNKKKEVEL